MRLSVENTYLQAQLDESKKILGTEDLSGLQNQIDLLTAQLATAESNAAEFKETVGRKLTATKAELNVVKSEKAKLNAELMKSKVSH